MRPLAYLGVGFRGLEMTCIQTRPVRMNATFAAAPSGLLLCTITTLLPICVRLRDAQPLILRSFSDPAVAAALANPSIFTMELASKKNMGPCMHALKMYKIPQIVALFWALFLKASYSLLVLLFNLYGSGRLSQNLSRIDDLINPAMRCTEPNASRIELRQLNPRCAPSIDSDIGSKLQGLLILRFYHRRGLDSPAVEEVEAFTTLLQC